METRTLQVNPEDGGARLDAWLAGQLPDVTRSAAARLWSVFLLLCFACRGG